MSQTYCNILYELLLATYRKQNKQRLSRDLEILLDSLLLYKGEIRDRAHLLRVPKFAGQFEVADVIQKYVDLYDELDDDEAASPIAIIRKQMGNDPIFLYEMPPAHVSQGMGSLRTSQISASSQASFGSSVTSYSSSVPPDDGSASGSPQVILESLTYRLYPQNANAKSQVYAPAVAASTSSDSVRKTSISPTLPLASLTTYLQPRGVNLAQVKVPIRPVPKILDMRTTPGGFQMTGVSQSYHIVNPRTKKSPGRNQRHLNPQNTVERTDKPVRRKWKPKVAAEVKPKKNESIVPVSRPGQTVTDDLGTSKRGLRTRVSLPIYPGTGSQRRSAYPLQDASATQGRHVRLYDLDTPDSSSSVENDRFADSQPVLRESKMGRTQERPSRSSETNGRKRKKPQEENSKDQPPRKKQKRDVIEISD